MNEWHVVYVLDHEIASHGRFYSAKDVETFLAGHDWKDPGNWIVTIIEGCEYNPTPTEKVVAYKLKIGRTETP